MKNEYYLMEQKMRLVILRGGAYPGLCEWDLHAITNVLIRKRQREEGQMGEENTEREHLTEEKTM